MFFPFHMISLNRCKTLQVFCICWKQFTHTQIIWFVQMVLCNRESAAVTLIFLIIKTLRNYLGINNSRKKLCGHLGSKIWNKRVEKKTIYYLPFYLLHTVLNSEWTSICFFKWCACLNSFPQILHKCSFSFLCIFVCRFNIFGSANLLSQTEQAWGFSPVCCLLWIFKQYNVLKALLQKVQV